MNLYNPIRLHQWSAIQDRYKEMLPNVTDERLIAWRGNNKELSWISAQILNDVIEFVKKPVEIKEVILFGQGPNNVQGLHVDGYSESRDGSSNWALNIPVLNCTQGEMIWYTGTYTYIPATNKSNIKFLQLQWQGELPKLNSRIIDIPTIVKVDIPHSVVNHSDKRRLMLSVRFTPDLF
jgi:hypothetical protein